MSSTRQRMLYSEWSLLEELISKAKMPRDRKVLIKKRDLVIKKLHRLAAADIGK